MDSLDTYFPDNITEQISPQDLRDFLTNLTDSVLTNLDDGPKLPFYNKNVFAGQLHYNAGWALLLGGSDNAINTSGIVTQDNEKIEIGASVTVTKWIFAGAWAEFENDAIELRVDKQSGGILRIYPMIGGPKVEFAHLTYNSGWGLTAGAQSTMTIGSSSDNQITLNHTDCQYNPASVLPRNVDRELSASTSISTNSTTIELRDSAGAAYTPSNGDAISVFRFSAVKGGIERVDPNELVVTNARINFFAIFE